MKFTRRIPFLAAVAAIIAGCEPAQSAPQPKLTSASVSDAQRQQAVAEKMEYAQQTPTDVRYSLERYNLIRRAYWVNGMRERAAALPCPVDKPLGYVVLVTRSGSVMGRFVVDGKVTSLRQYLTPESEYFEMAMGGGTEYTSLRTELNKWLPDTDGCYGDNAEGIFFFTPDGRYIEWTGDYLFSDIPFTVKDPVLRTDGVQVER